MAIPTAGPCRAYKAITLDDVKDFTSITRRALALGNGGRIGTGGRLAGESNLASLPRQARDCHRSIRRLYVRTGGDDRRQAGRGYSRLSIGFPIDVVPGTMKNSTRWPWPTGLLGKARSMASSCRTSAAKHRLKYGDYW